MKKKQKIITYFINLSFFLYFIILIIERSISVITSIQHNVDLYENGYYAFTYTLVFISITAWLIFLLIRCRNNIKALFRFNDEELFDNLSFTDICIASGILLLSGMVHTEFTQSVIQFISYGILIMGILLKAILVAKNNDKVITWLSFSYLVAFSMAVPVMYPSLMSTYQSFHFYEAVASCALVATFTFLLVKLFQDKNDLFILWPLLLMLALNAGLIIWRWQEEINYFVLIFSSISLILFIIGFIFKIKRMKEE